jgi:hypothetical protein
MSQKDKSTNDTIPCINLSFLFLYVHFEFGSKKIRDDKPMSSEH